MLSSTLLWIAFVLHRSHLVLGWKAAVCCYKETILTTDSISGYDTRSNCNEVSIQAAALGGNRGLPVITTGGACSCPDNWAPTEVTFQGNQDGMLSFTVPSSPLNQGIEDFTILESGMGDGSRHEVGWCYGCSPASYACFNVKSYVQFVDDGIPAPTGSASSVANAKKTGSNARGRAAAAAIFGLVVLIAASVNVWRDMTTNQDKSWEVQQPESPL